MSTSAQSLESIARALAAAYTNAGSAVSGDLVTGLSRPEALLVQQQVAMLLGERTETFKVAILPDGTPVVAPIFSTISVENDGHLPWPAYGMVGCEVEVAVRLKSPLTAEIAARGEAAVLETVDAFLVGIELIGTRLVDRKAAGEFGPLADNLVSAGFVTGPVAALAIEGLPISVTLDGQPLFSGTARHPFGGVLQPLIAYAQSPSDRFGALDAGRVITTGALSGLIPMSGAGRIEARLGDFAPATVTIG